MKVLSAKRIFVLLALLFAAAIVALALLPKGGNGEYAFTARVLSVEEQAVTVDVLEQHPGFLVKRLPKQFLFAALPDMPLPASGDTICGMVMPSSIQSGTARVMTYEIINH